MYQSQCFWPTPHPNVLHRQWSLAIRDTIIEFQDSIRAGAELEGAVSDNLGTGGSGRAGISGLDLDVGHHGSGAFDAGDLETNYTASELLCVQASVSVLKSLRRCLAAANKAFNDFDVAEADASAQTETPATDVETPFSTRLAWVNNLQAGLSNATEAAGDLGVLLYPPLDTAALLHQTDALEVVLFPIFDILDRAGLQVSGVKPDEARELEAAQVSSCETPLKACMEARMTRLRERIAALND